MSISCKLYFFSLEFFKIGRHIRVKESPKHVKSVFYVKNIIQYTPKYSFKYMVLEIELGSRDGLCLYPVYFIR